MVDCGSSFGGCDAPSTAVTDSTTTATTEETIKAKYYPRFDRLRNEATARLDQLAANGYAEYKQSRATGKPSFQDLAAKYLGAGKQLEQGVNSVFYDLLGQMQTELKQAGLSQNLAKQAEQEYKASIQQKKSELLSKAFK